MTTLAASWANAALTHLTTIERNLTDGRTPSPALREALLRAAGAEADALRPFDAYARHYARDHVAYLLNSGHLAAIRERFTRHTTLLPEGA